MMPTRKGKEHNFKAFYEGVIFDTAKQVLEKNGIDKPGGRQEGPLFDTEPDFQYQNAKRYHRATEQIMSMLIDDFWDCPDLRTIRQRLGQKFFPPRISTHGRL